MIRHTGTILLAVSCCFLFAVPALAQQPVPHSARAVNKPLTSISEAGRQARLRSPRFGPQPREVPNQMFKADTRAVNGKAGGADPVLQSFNPTSSASLVNFFDGADNYDNSQENGYMVSPPDTDGDVGPNHFVQMVNNVTAIFDKTGARIDVFPSDAFWLGAGGACETSNDGDPIVLYDGANDRWIVSHFVNGPDAQCIAYSQTGDPAGAYNRYEFDFTTIGFPDYPKHGITTNAVTMTAHLFNPSFAGQYIGAIDLQAMRAGTAATLVGFNLGTSEGGFVAADLDGSGSSDALFATAMSRTNLFDIWRIVPNFGAGTGTVSRIAAIPVPAFSGNLCTASREACIPQPDGAPKLESLSDRLMHRLQIRDFAGSHKSMLASHTVDAGGGRSGIRWYEMRDTGGGWALYQSGTYAPDDGQYRWMPSIAMNAAGDIGLGYMLSSTSTYVSIGVAGQSAAGSGSGVIDSGEQVCAVGNRTHSGTNRSGDYSSTAVDESTGNFWHTNEYFRTSPFTSSAWFWATGVCEFNVQPGVVASSVHISNIETGTQNAKRRTRSGTAVVTVVTDTGSRVAGATVTGSFSGTFVENVSGVTGADGTVAFVTSGSTRNGLTVNFCVSNVTASLPYVDADNGDPSYACSGGGGGGDPTLVVTSVQTGSRGIGGGQKVGTATVTVTDQNGTPVGTANVTGNFGGSIVELGVSATTNGSGIANLETTDSKSGKVNETFCITSVSKSGLVYNGSPFDCTGSSKTDVASKLETVDSITLEPNYPNPFNPSTLLAFELLESAPTSVRVYNLLGREVSVVFDGFLDAGRHSFRFDGTDLPAGMYLYSVNHNNRVATGWITLIK